MQGAGRARPHASILSRRMWSGTAATVIFPRRRTAPFIFTSDWASDGADAPLNLQYDAERSSLAHTSPMRSPPLKRSDSLGWGPLLFYDIDTPITIPGCARAGSTEYLIGLANPPLRRVPQLYRRPVRSGTEAKPFWSPRAVAFYCSVDAAVYHPVSSRPALSSAI